MSRLNDSVDDYDRAAPHCRAHDLGPYSHPTRIEEGNSQNMERRQAYRGPRLNELQRIGGGK